MAFSPDGTYMMTARRELFETTTWKKRWSHAPEQTDMGFDAREIAVEFSPDVPKS